MACFVGADGLCNEVALRGRPVERATLLMTWVDAHICSSAILGPNRIATAALVSTYVHFLVPRASQLRGGYARSYFDTWQR